MLGVLKAHDAIRSYLPEPCKTPAAGKSMHKILSDLRADLLPTIHALNDSSLESELARANGYCSVDLGGKSYPSYVVGVMTAGLFDYTAALWAMREESLEHFDNFSAVVFSSGNCELPVLELEPFAKHWPAIAKRIAELPRIDTQKVWLELRGERFRFDSRPKAPPSRKRAAGEPKPITTKQAEAMKVVAECEGNIAKAAKQLGRNRSTIEGHYNAATKKLGQAARPKPKTTQLARDRRGQVDSPRDDRRRHGRMPGDDGVS